MMRRDGGKKAELPEYMKPYLKQVDKAFCNQFERMSKNFTASIEKVEQRLDSCEKRMYKYIKQTESIAHADLSMAESLVNKELRFKHLMGQWTNKFLVHSGTKSLDALTWAFARLSLNVCLCWSDIPAKHFLQAGVHKSLANFIKFKSELVIGPALMALVHISILPDLKPAIVLVDVLPTIIKLLVTSESKPILCQACKLIASLALHFPNKSLISNSGNLHGLLDLILGNNKEINDSISQAALMGVVNAIQGSDSNRMLMVNLNGIKPLLSTLQHSSNKDLMLQAIRALANVSYCSTFCAGALLTLGGDRVLLEVLETSDINKDAIIVHASLAAISNICYSEATQSHVGASAGIMETAIRICQHAAAPFVVAEAAVLILAMIWSNIGNKARCNGCGSVAVLVARILKHCQIADEPNLSCMEKCCEALSSQLLAVQAQERFLKINALEDMIKVCRQSSEQRVVAALSQIIVCLVPSPDELLRMHEDDYPVPVEKQKALPVLKKAKFIGFGHLTL